MQHTFDTPGPVDLVVELGRGAVRVRATDAATPDSTTVVTVTGQRAEEVVVEQQDDEVRVIGPRHGLAGLVGGEPRLDVTVVLPAESRLGARLGSADLVVTGALTSTRVRSGSGDVTLATVVEDASVETGSGDIRIDLAGGLLQLTAGSGDVVVTEARAGGGVSTGSGDVRVGTTGASFGVKTGSGDVVVEQADHGLTVSTASGDLQVRRTAGGRITTRAASGAVAIGVTAGVPVWTDITTVSGRIRSSLPSTGEPEPGQPHLELHTVTVSGDVTLAEA